MDNKEKCIGDMANVYYDAMLKARGTLGSMNEGAPKWYAKHFYEAGYRKQEWISVDDKLPKHCQKVLVCDERHNMVTAMYVTYDNGGFDWCTSVRLVYKVTHWMPLPEPPETKGETE